MFDLIFFFFTAPPPVRPSLSRAARWSALGRRLSGTVLFVQSRPPLPACATQTNYYVQPEDGAKGCPAHKTHLQQQEIARADLWLESKVSTKQFNRSVLCFGATRGGSQREGAGWDWIFTATITWPRQIYRLALSAPLQPASPPLLCLDAAPDSKLRPGRYRGLDQRADVSSNCKEGAPDF